MSRVKIFIAGDSTAADYPPDRAPMAGWGQMLPPLLTDEVEVRNAAKCGRSSKSFIGEGRLEKIREQLGSGDYLFIQFGHNDQKPDEKRQTEPEDTYPATLQLYIDAAREAGAHPVLFTSVERRKFSPDGRLEDTHGAYPDAVRELARAQELPLVDLQLRTRELYETLGPEASTALFVHLEPGAHENYPEGLEDNTHFSEHGARAVARLAAEALYELGLPVKVEGLRAQ